MERIRTVALTEAANVPTFEPRRWNRAVRREVARRLTRSGVNGVGGPHDVKKVLPRGQAHGAVRLVKTISHHAYDRGDLAARYPGSLSPDVKPEERRLRRA